MMKMFSHEVNTYDMTDELSSRLLNRDGSYSEDRRIDDHDFSSILGPGPRTGCHGDTVSATVKINAVDVVNDGDTAANIVVSYSGKYTRQGWIKGCIQAPPPSGREDRDIHGKFTLRVRQKPFKGVEITWGTASDLGEVAGPEHDSNVMAVAAVRAAINGAF